MKKIFILLITAFAISCCRTNTETRIIISNTSNIDRENEIVEVSSDSIYNKLGINQSEQFILSDENGKQIAYQVTYDKKIIFPVNVVAGKTSSYYFKIGTPNNFSPSVFGRHFPERLDDMTWENDRIAFRAFGPAIQNKGDKTYGYDVWTKRVPDLVVEKRYALFLNKKYREQIGIWKREGKKAKADSLSHAISEHVDHGNGMDCYGVGATLGCGTSALLEDSAIVYPNCFKEFEVLDNGPLRFTVKLRYNPLTVKNDSNVIETRIIQLDKGSNLNKTMVTYDNLSCPTPVVTGLVVHSANINTYGYSVKNGYISYPDPTVNTNNGNGTLYVGAVIPQGLKKAGVQWLEKPVSGAKGHVLGISEYTPGSTYLYYWGAGWSKFGFSTNAEWDNYLKDYSYKVRNPLTIQIVNK